MAAGELSKEGRTIKFNLESGTYTRNLMVKTRNLGVDYVGLVKNALRNMNANKNYVTNILIPKVPGSLQNLITRGNLSFYHGTPTEKTKARVLANLQAAGLNTNSAKNLIMKLINPAKRLRNN